MYTATKQEDIINQEIGRRLLKVQFSNGTHIFSKDYSFSINTTAEQIKQIVKSNLDEINVAPAVLCGDIGLPALPPPAPLPTQAELERMAWFKKREQLSTLMLLVRDGVFVGNETQITNLQTEVRTGFKAAYLS